SLSYTSYYQFSPDLKYVHYLVLKNPFKEQFFYEKRQGRIELYPSTPGELSAYSLMFFLEKSTCPTSNESLFWIFDVSNKAHLERVENAITLKFPDIELKTGGNFLQQLIDIFYISYLEIFAEIFFAPFTPEFWKEIITGLHYTGDQNEASLTNVLSNGKETCLSKEGFRAIEKSVEIPQSIQLILQKKK
ncbi:MAG: hypothetical protein HQK54_17055, partial [Oligoflexales bacterium]|nr:hypothetical protein [Oligoflexales bacterium]